MAISRHISNSALFVFLLLLSLSPALVSAGPATSTSIDGFIANVGQWPSDVLYVARQNGADVWITRTGIVVDSYQTSVEDAMRTGTVLREAFRGINSGVRASTGPEVSRVSFVKGNDPNGWFSAPVYSSVALVDYYPGITFAYFRGADGRVSRTITAREGADLSRISYEILGGANPVAADVAPATSTVYGAYVGGPNTDVLIGLEYQTNGGVVIAGSTSGMEFPGAAGGYSTTVKGTSDGFLARFDAKLQKVLAYTFIGGSGDDRIRGLTKDAQNNIYVCGETSSNDFPTTSGVTGKLYKAGIDAFVAKFDSTLTKLLVGFYHGGNKDDVARAIAVDRNNLIYLAGGTNSTTNFPVTFPATIRVTIPGRRPSDPPTYRDDPAGGTNLGQTDGFIASFSVNGSLQQSRFFGREGVEFFTAMAVDASSSVYLTGSTTSANFETAPTSDRFTSGRVPYDRTFNGGITDGFVVKLNNELALAKSDDGTYSTFFGGSGEDEGRGIFVDDLGRAHVVGNTTSPNLETIGSLFTQYFGSQDAFLALFSDDGRDLNSATYYGGTGREDVLGVQQYTTPTTSVIFGTTASNDFPVIGEGVNGNRAGATDGFVVLINTATNIFSTLVPGNGNDTIRAMDVNPIGDLYFGAHTTSTDLHTHDSTYQKSGAGREIYVAKYAFGTLELTAPAGGEAYCVGANKSISWSALGIPDTAKFRIQIAPDGSENWSDVKQGATGRTFQWKVPAMTSGKYIIRISSSRGHVSKLLSPISVSDPPAITTQPKNTSACTGKPASLSVVASGALLKYQWRKNGTDIAGATSPMLDISSVDASTLGQYACVVAGACSPSVTSQTVTLAIAQAMTISTQPMSQTIEQNKQLKLTVVASGGDLTYQWSKDGSPITGATSAEYVVSSAALTDAGKYSCDVAGGCGHVISNEVTVVVTPTTSVDEQYEAGDTWVRLLGPSPTSDAVAIRVRLSEPTLTTARVYNEQGLMVGTIDLGLVSANESDIQLSLSRFVTGVYAVEIKAGSLVGHIRVIVRR
ncbi:MAG: SBBP repeat-containing protein [Candidatus Kapabacteria bacterium]|nr:SBBP repeat-containing protein [Candidatus Kapabacteria bacterium]